MFAFAEQPKRAAAQQEMVTLFRFQLRKSVQPEQGAAAVARGEKAAYERAQNAGIRRGQLHGEQQ